MIAGPTAGGKSRLAQAIAGAFGGTVINADSLQLYRDLAILTARPTAADEARVPHRLYGFLASDERRTAGDWRDMAGMEINSCAATGRLPVIVGGSGLYLSALLDGLHRIPQVPRTVREAVRRRLEAEGARALHRELARLDPETARRLAPGDSQRIVRALEVLSHTGRGLADWRDAEVRDGVSDTVFLNIAVMPPRDLLYSACERRFRRMVTAGAVAEVEAFITARPPDDCPLWKAVGVRPIARLLEGGISEDEMVSCAGRDTRRYAKRQMTWFRNRFRADLTLGAAHAEDTGAGVLAAVGKFLLTGSR